MSNKNNGETRYKRCNAYGGDIKKLVNSICCDLDTIKEKRPLIHSITNYVMMNETANALLCLGALPVMAHAKEEVEEMVSKAGALVLNIGTLEPYWIEAMETAGKHANELDIPIILDPVGVGATTYRTNSARRLLDSVKISILRGNPGEIAALSGLSSEVRGVESISADVNEQVAADSADKFGCVVAITGADDFVSDGKRTTILSNGHRMLSKVVGTGCISSVIIGAFNAVEQDALIAAVGGLTVFGIAGEIAASAAPDRPGTYHTELYNALYGLESIDLRCLAKISLYQ